MAHLSFRPSKANADIIKSLRRLAEKDKRSLNNYIELLFLNHLKNKKR